MKELWCSIPKFRVMAVLALGGLLIAGGALLQPRSSSSAATAYKDSAGGGQPNISVETYRPSVIFVNEGDTVQFVNPFAEIHTVTFLAGAPMPDLIIPVPGPQPKAGPPTLEFNPAAAFPAPSPNPTFDGTTYTNSGILNPNDSFSVTFSKQGVYNFLCLVHGPEMSGEVHVLPKGVNVPTQAQRDFEAQQQLAAGVAKAQQMIAGAPALTSTRNASGATTWNLTAGLSSGPIDVFAFIPDHVKINVGDTVTWTNNTDVPHTVTFASGGDVPDIVSPQPQAGGPPLLLANPQVVFPSNTGPTYDGTGFVNSGLIGAGPPAVAGNSFSLTFTKAGTYQYVCALHDDAGMKGVIDVGLQTTSPAGTISPPNTGDAGLARGASGPGSWYWLLAAIPALMALGGLAVGVRATRRR